MVSPCNPTVCPPQTGLPWTGQVTVYKAGDDGTYQKGYTTDRPIVKGAGSTRFTDNGDGTVTDNATGLMWVKNPLLLGPPFDTFQYWAQSITACEGLTYAGHSDWRLPNVKELVSVLDYALAAPYVDPYFFPAIVLNYYWTSTTSINNTTFAYYANLSSGTSYPNIAARSKTSYKHYIWPVRLGQP